MTTNINSNLLEIETKSLSIGNYLLKIERIDKQIPEDEWYFFEITLSTYDGLNVDKVVYLPIRY